VVRKTVPKRIKMTSFEQKKMVAEDIVLIEI